MNRERLKIIRIKRAMVMNKPTLSMVLSQKLGMGLLKIVSAYFRQT
jgi:hypothetical protein